MVSVVSTQFDVFKYVQQCFRQLLTGDLR
jgi:hypothetical protein